MSNIRSDPRYRFDSDDSCDLIPLSEIFKNVKKTRSPKQPTKGRCSPKRVKSAEPEQSVVISPFKDKKEDDDDDDDCDSKSIQCQPSIDDRRSTTFKNSLKDNGNGLDQSLSTISPIKPIINAILHEKNCCSTLDRRSSSAYFRKSLISQFQSSFLGSDVEVILDSTSFLQEYSLVADKKIAENEQPSLETKLSDQVLHSKEIIENEDNAEVCEQQIVPNQDQPTVLKKLSESNFDLAQQIAKSSEDSFLFVTPEKALKMKQLDSKVKPTKICEIEIISSDDEVSLSDDEITPIFVSEALQQKSAHNSSSTSFTQLKPFPEKQQPSDDDRWADLPPDFHDDQGRFDYSMKDSSFHDKLISSTSSNGLKRSSKDVSFLNDTLDRLLKDIPSITSISKQTSIGRLNEEKEEEEEEEIAFNSPVVTKPVRKRNKLSETEKRRKQDEKDRKRKEREELKRVKEIQKEKQKLIRNANAVNSQRHALKYVTMLIDRGLLDAFGKTEQDCRDWFENNEIKFMITEELPVELSVQWRRQVVNLEESNVQNRLTLEPEVGLQLEEFSNEVEEDQVLLLISRQQIDQMLNDFCRWERNGADSTKEYELLELVLKRLRFYRKNLLFIVHGLDACLKQRKNKDHREFMSKMKPNKKSSKTKTTAAAVLTDEEEPIQITKADYDCAVLDVQMKLRFYSDVDGFKVVFQNTETKSDLGAILCSMHKAVANAPFKRQRSQQLGFEWFAEGDARNVKVKITGTADIRRLWIKQLMQFDKISYDIARTIGETYPGPIDLLKKYDQLTCKRDRELLLTHLIVGKTTNNPGRKINSTISKRVHRFLTTSDPNELLNNEF